MPRRRLVRLLSRLLLLLAIVALGCEEVGDCDMAALRMRLASATPGTVVGIGSCRVRGSLVVPAGVVLEGSPTTPPITAPGESFVIDLTSSAATDTPTIVRGVRIEARSQVGVRCVGAGYARVDDVSLDIDSAIGIAARDVTGFGIHGARIQGSIDEVAATALAPAAGPEEGGSYGIVLVRVGNTLAPSEIHDIVMGDAGPWGSLVDHSSVEFTNVRISGGVGIGIQAIASSVGLEDVRVENVIQGRQVLPAMGAVIVGESTARTTRFVIDEIEGIGMLIDHSATEHIDLTASACAFGGVWAQDSPSIRITGSSLLSHNGLVGIGLVEVASAEFDGARVEQTELGLTIPDGSASGVEIGDGILVRGTLPTLTVRNIVLTGNARVGFVADLASGALDGVSLESVEVTSEGTGLGVIAQIGGMLAPRGTWDSGVMRMGAAIENDDALTIPLEVPSQFPASMIPTPIVE